MKLPPKIDIRTAIILFILAVVLTISGASILLDHFSFDRGASGLAAGSIGLDIGTKPGAPPPPAPPAGPPGAGSVGGAGGGGGGGGGGSGGPNLQPKILRFQEEIKVITKGDNKNIIIPEHVSTTIRMINFDLSADQNEVLVKVRNYGYAGTFVNKPFSVSDAPGAVHTYCEIEVLNLEQSALDNVWINFRVERDWINSNRIGDDTIKLYRFNEEKWGALETIQTSKSSEYIYYKAKTPGFSVFAISGSVTRTGMHILFDSNVTIHRGATQTLTVILENTGELPLSDVVLTTQDTLFDITFAPETIEELPVASKGTYLMTVYVPGEASPGTYATSLLAKSAESSIEQFFDIIIPSTAKPSAEVLLSEQISGLKRTANKLWLETQWMGLRGANVSGVFAFITSAKEKLANADDSFGMINLEETRGYVEGAGSDLEKAVINLAAQQPLLRLFKMSPLLIGVIVIILLVVGLFSYKALHKYEHSVKEHKKVVKGEAHDEAYKDAQKQSRLAKKLALVEESYSKGYIKKKEYAAEKARLERKLGKNKK